MKFVKENKLQTKQEGFRPRRRIQTKKSDAELKDEELQRKLKEAIQQGLADKDMDFTPRESDSTLKQDILSVIQAIV